MKTVFSFFLVTLGIFLVIYSLYISFKRLNPKRLSFQNYKNVIQKSKKTILPKKLIIKDLNINLPVETVEIKNGVWPISEVGVSYLFSSATPGQTGNAIFYGHNFENILVNLKNAKIGQIIEIYMKNSTLSSPSKRGSYFLYEISAITTVKPTQIDILKNSKNAILTLYTCSGFFDENRLVVTARLIK
jgi:LPXTG-site transpeptidase (sortase) family protein